MTTRAPRHTKLNPVPIDEIFDVECKALKIGAERQKELRDMYEGHVFKMTTALLNRLGVKDISDARAMKDLVNSIDELELFSQLTYVFHIAFGAVPSTSPASRLVVNAIQSNEFNCYSGTVLLADILGRLGKSTDIAYPTTDNVPWLQHVLLVGESYFFETTNKSPESAVYPKGPKIRHPFEDGVEWPYAEKPVETLLVMTYNNCIVTPGIPAELSIEYGTMLKKLLYQ